MKQKAFAIFVGLVMVLSAFAGFVLRGGNSPPEEALKTGTGSLSDFGVSGKLVDWPFTNIGEMLETCPENLIIAYWIDLERSQNLTEAARAILSPNMPSIGLSYSDVIYTTRIEKAGAAVFDDGWAEFHWMVPAKVRYEGLVIPYNDFMIIPWSTEYSTVMGQPTLFGPQINLEKILDVITGESPTDKFSLPYDEGADFQVASLGIVSLGSSSSATKNISLPLKGGFQEFYLGVSVQDEGYKLIAKYLSPTSSTSQKLKELAKMYNLQLSANEGYSEIFGTVDPIKLNEVLGAFLAP